VVRHPHNNSVVTVAVSGDGNLLASASVDGTIDVVNLASLDEAFRRELLSDMPPAFVALSAGKRYLAELYPDGKARVSESLDGKAVGKPVVNEGATQVSVSAAGDLLIGGTPGVKLYDHSGQPTFSVDSVADALDVTPDGRYVAVANRSGVEVYDAARSASVWKFPAQDEHMQAVSFTTDGKRLLLSGDKPQLRVFATATGEAPAPIAFAWHNDCGESREPCKVNGLSSSVDSKFAVLSITDKTARLLDLVHGRETAAFDLPAAVVFAVLSDDNRYLATASGDWVGRVYEVATKREVWHTALGPNDFFPMGFESGDKFLLAVRVERRGIVLERRLWRKQDLVERGCGLLSRNLNEGEWNRLFSNEPLPLTCNTIR
jgi:WD40 repeat protein